MRVLALIAARGGSKGLPDKNVRAIRGVPLLVRAVKLARRCASSRWTIAVSTDHAGYAELATAAGATVIPRPDELATDRARLIDVVHHALTVVPCDLVLLLSATTPLTRASDVRSALALWQSSGGAIASVCADTPPALRFTLTGAGHMSATTDSLPGHRQEAIAHYRLNGAIYIATPAWLRHYGRFVVSGMTRPVVMPPHRSIDIETIDDLRLARRVMRRIKRSALAKI